MKKIQTEEEEKKELVKLRDIIDKYSISLFIKKDKEEKTQKEIINNMKKIKDLNKINEIFGLRYYTLRDNQKIYLFYANGSYCAGSNFQDKVDLQKFYGNEKINDKREIKLTILHYLILQFDYRKIKIV